MLEFTLSTFIQINIEIHYELHFDLMYFKCEDLYSLNADRIIVKYC